MAASSKHYGDIVNWIEKIIDSCETQQQEVAARKLVRQFETLYYDIDQQLGWGLSRKLRNKLDEKFYALIHKNIESNQNPE